METDPATEDPANRYKAFDLEATDIGDHRRLLHVRRSGKTGILPASMVDLLFSCEEFGVIEDHAEQRTRAQRSQLAQGSPSSLRQRMFAGLLRFAGDNDISLPLQESEIGPIREKLRSLVEGGWLTSEEDVRYEVMRRCQEAAPSPGGAISSIGIPTHEGRAATLKRSLSSYVQHLMEYGRHTDIIIMDDTPPDAESGVIRRTLLELSDAYRGTIYYGDRNMRREAASALAEQAGVPERVVRFALLGDTRCTITTGSTRNALLLDTIGELTLQVDDDTFCHLNRAPNLRRGLRLSSRSLPRQMWFDPLDEGPGAEKDLLALHETLLGSNPQTHIQKTTDLNVKGVEGSFLRKLSLDNQAIAYTVMGTRGDSGWNAVSNIHRVQISDRTSFQHLTETDAAYRQRLNTRNVLQSVPQSTITTSPYCMAGNIGLDHRHLLPPFLPVQRNQDGIWGDLAYICGPGWYGGHLPFTVAHRPPGARSHAAEVDGGGIAATHLGPRVPDLIEQALFRHAQAVPGPDPARNMCRLGEIMSDLGSLNTDLFISYFRSLHRQLIVRRMQRAKRRLENERYAIDLWKADIKTYIQAHQNLLCQENASMPIDLSGSSEERWALLKELVRQFGDLLLYWPSIVRAVKNRGVGKSRRRIACEIG